LSSLEENVGDYAATTKHVQINQWDVNKSTRQCAAKNDDKGGNITRRVAVVPSLLDCDRYKKRKAVVYFNCVQNT
jgi:hypothetical protein